jgi:MHS family alpha-ketoglutarate permease-like MFS transporter
VAAMGGTAGLLVVWLGGIGLGWLFPVYAAVLALLSIVLYTWARRSEGVFVGE